MVIASPPTYTACKQVHISAYTYRKDMEGFYQRWIQGQEQLLQELLHAMGDDVEESELKDLVRRTLRHFHSYYRERSRIAEDDVLLVYHSPWLTSVERTFLWIGGWKPSLLLRLSRKSPLCDEQERAVREIESETAEEEKALMEELVRVQDLMALLQVALVARRAAARDGEVSGEVEAEVEEQVMERMRVLLASADDLRARVIQRLLELLTVEKQVKFMAAVVEFHLRIRRWGTYAASGTIA